MQAITSITSKTVVLPNTDVDTDQIIPARFLTTTQREGLGKNLFSEWRFDNDGNERTDFILNTPEAKDCSILVAGDNFGCGSSREHAPWALLDFGIKVVISTSMADIFKSNALKNGLLPIIVEKDIHQQLLDRPGMTVCVDLEQQQLTADENLKVSFEIDSFARYCIMNGVDELGFLLQQLPSINQFEKNL